MRHLFSTTLATLVIATITTACPPADSPPIELERELDKALLDYAKAIKDGSLVPPIPDGPYIYSPRVITPPVTIPDDLNEKMMEELFRRALDELGKNQAQVTPPITIDFPNPYLELKMGVEAERLRNTDVYERDYGAIRVALFDDHAGQWLVIAGGEILPKNSNGHVTPAATMDVAVAAADAAHPHAQHRFVFRIGEDGDTSYHFTLSPHDDVAGRQFLRLLSPRTVVAVDGLYLRDVPLGEPGKSTRIVAAREDGVYAPVAFRAPAPAHTAQDQKATVVDLHVATGYSGFATISAEHADALRISRWEIPGTIHVEGWAPMRRARVHASMDGTNLDQLIIVGVRAR